MGSRKSRQTLRGLQLHCSGDSADGIKVLSRRIAHRTVQLACNLTCDDIDRCNVERTDLVAQVIHLLMGRARMGLVQNNSGAVVGPVSQLD